ncbi:GFA family protein [Oleiagrimonas sp. C23AA]|uniref:GFA family protein n=1 Tax=Oleiagrimonas sp. C23AA TaxID=2719047 RepID=UPI001422E2AB|nr:GFA family protein [Oleiagrimonas sp. C23AA]NII12179.1 GFA family protein [Oleiagrimonas sp. C23AA]
MIEGQCHCGAVHWRFDTPLEAATLCNCTLCRRYAVLWAYGHEGEGVTINGPTNSYRHGAGELAFHFCEQCGCVTHWRAMSTDEQGRRRMAVNLRLADPKTIATLPLNRFDGLDTFKALSDDGRRVGDILF